MYIYIIFAYLRNYIKNFKISVFRSIFEFFKNQSFNNYIIEEKWVRYEHGWLITLYSTLHVSIHNIQYQYEV